MMNQPGRKVCFMTGATGKLGREIALAVAGMGYSVFFTWHASQARAEETLEQLRLVSPGSQMTRCDISDVPEIHRAFAEFLDRFDRLDLLVSSASNFYRTDLFDVTGADWDRLVDTNLKGSFFTMQAAGRIMKEQPFLSRIITMTDVSADLGWRNFAPYTVSKAGIQHLTRIFARELAPRTLVNAIAPGTISHYADKEQEPESGLLEKIPLGRFGDPADVVRALRFLMESGYTTGQVITVDGGRMLY